MEVIFMRHVFCEHFCEIRILRDWREGFYQENAMAADTPERRMTERRVEVERRGQGLHPLGGSGGRGIAEMLDPAGEEAYWRENYEAQPHFEAGYAYDDYHPAYRAGWEGRARYEGRNFDDVERDLRADYERRRGGSRLDWERCREAARAAWNRFDATDDFERSQ
jgi:hypothetical protein